MTINKIYEDIVKLTHLSPSKEVNNAFTNLVNEAIKYEADGKLTKNEVQKLQTLSAEAEYQLEIYWANKIINAKSPKKELAKFPYLQNYKDLTKLEVNSLYGCTNHKKHKYAFVGGGPLPMTAIVLASEYGIESTVIDIDEQAVEKGRSLVDLLGLSQYITIQHVGGESFDYSNFNVVFIAALAGLDSEVKHKIFKQIKATAQRGMHILARSSWRNRKLLYKPLDSSIYKIFKPIIKVDPFNDIVNSIVILKYV